MKPFKTILEVQRMNDRIAIMYMVSIHTQITDRLADAIQSDMKTKKDTIKVSFF
jgi:hypothetical protein